LIEGRRRVPRARAVVLLPSWPAAGLARGRPQSGSVAQEPRGSARCRTQWNRTFTASGRTGSGVSWRSGWSGACPAGTDGARHGKCSTATAGVLDRERGDREEINLELLAWLGL
jgi:hypothetical protein